METLDFTGLNCPMPVIKLKKYLAQNISATEAPWSVQLQITDKAGLRDIPAFCQQQKLNCKHLLSSEQLSEGVQNNVITFIISN